MSDAKLIKPAAPAAGDAAAGDAPAPVVAAAAGRPLSWSSLAERLGPAGPLALAAAILPAIGGFVLLGFMGPVADWLHGHAEWGVFLYVFGFALLSGLALLPTWSQAILGGFAFGFSSGFPAALGGFLGGSLLGYFIARRAAGDRVVRLIQEQPRWAVVYDALLGSGAARSLLIVTLLRLPPNSPFAMTNLLMAATRVPLPLYAVGTILGLAPRTGIAVLAGQSMKVFDPREAMSWVWVVTGVVLMLVALGVIGAIANRALARVAAGRANAACEAQPSE
jgi:uncharacterized membrane protein YdjX (TVP38/TMEM64 family)